LSTVRLASSVVLIIAAALSAACSTPRAATLYGYTDLTGTEFDDVLRTWTRSEKIYRGLENKAFVSATYHSPELRRAFQMSFPDIYGHGGEITRRELVDLTGDVEQYHTFFVTMYTPLDRWNDLGQPDSIWRLQLTGVGSNGQIEVEPERIVQVKIDENLRTVYSHIDRFDKAYLVRFPLAGPIGGVVLGPETRRFMLRIASALGSAELVWELEPPTTSPAQDPVTGS
jgi:hypothetical protein